MELKQLFRTVLVIGDEPDEIIKKYSLNTKVEPYLLLKKADIAKYKSNKILLLKETIKSGILNEEQKKLTNEYIKAIEEMSDLDYYLSITENCEYDKNGDAYSTNNPNAFYCNERSPQSIFEKTGQETGFCNPFKLKDDYISYSAEMSDIDWSLNHKNNEDIYRIAWRLVVNNEEPKNEKEELIKNNMKNRKSYFSNFANEEEYVIYNTSFWTYGVATENTYEEIGMYGIDNKTWIISYYDKYIKNLPQDTLLTIYEVQGLN